MNTQQATGGPIVPPHERLPEITPKAVLLSVLLAAILAGANAYLGLFAGMTVSASIPAAVVSMAVLRLFAQSNILENNIVQTAASSGEALAAGVIFTIPALVLIGHWTSFHYLDTLTVSLVGGMLGVLFTIPLRHALIVQAKLRFPEGTATAEVLKAGAGRGSVQARGIRTLVTAAALGGGVKFCESGLRLWADSIEGAVQLGRAAAYGGLQLSPALLAVGFIIGLNISLVVAMGAVIGWIILVPLYQIVATPPEDVTPMAAAMSTWSQSIRYVGIGAMFVGGVWTLTEVRGPLLHSLRKLRARSARTGADEQLSIPRTEQDATATWLIAVFLLCFVPMVVLYQGIVGSPFVALLMAVIMAGAAFLFSTVAGYMAGLVGSSSNPVSGVTIATIMLASLLLVMVLGHQNPVGPAAALLIGAVVCCAAAMGGDNLQDLKTGHLVGATPWKQQIMQVVGVTSAALVIAPILSLLHAKYGIGEAAPDHPQPLTAPQATLMASLARGLFGEGLPWGLVALGGSIAFVVIALDRRQAARRSSVRFPVLAVGLGIYLPLKLSAAIFAGGLLAEAVRKYGHRAPGSGTDSGLLRAAGLITGEALLGILLAFPIAASQLWPALGKEPFQVFATPPLGGWPGLVAMLCISAWLCRASLRRFIQ